MNHFRITAKFGHVGRKYYYECDVYVSAKTAKEAANCVRHMPRVKHHHKDAILSVEKIDLVQYNQGLIMMRNDPYFSCRSIQDQKAMCQNLYEVIKAETLHIKTDDDTNSDRAKRNILQKLQRKQDKYKSKFLECI